MLVDRSVLVQNDWWHSVECQERSRRTHHEEFYQVHADPDQPPAPIACLPHPTGIRHSLEKESHKGQVSLIYGTSARSWISAENVTSSEVLQDLLHLHL